MAVLANASKWAKAGVRRPKHPRRKPVFAVVAGWDLDQVGGNASEQVKHERLGGSNTPGGFSQEACPRIRCTT